MQLNNPLDFAIQEKAYSGKFKFSVCTLVTNMQEYKEMITSFENAGFKKDQCEFRYIDNTTTNSYDAYRGLNLFLQNAQGEYIILCHQDILLNFDDKAVLEKRMAEITALDDNWGVLSNAGGIENDLYQRYAISVVYHDGFHQRIGALPQKVVSADENFIVVKRSANLALSANLQGFHLYGTDLCLIAELLGYSAYVIDFKLTHKSYGKPDEGYYTILNKLIGKYAHFMRNRRMLTTIGDFYLSASKTLTGIKQLKFIKKADRKITKLKVKKQ